MIEDNNDQTIFQRLRGKGVDLVTLGLDLITVGIPYKGEPEEKHTLTFMLPQGEHASSIPTASPLRGEARDNFDFRIDRRYVAAATGIFDRLRNPHMIALIVNVDVMGILDTESPVQPFRLEVKMKSMELKFGIAPQLSPLPDGYFMEALHQLKTIKHTAEYTWMQNNQICREQAY